jgi:hypothetical protein
MKKRHFGVDNLLFAIFTALVILGGVLSILAQMEK